MSKFIGLTRATGETELINLDKIERISPADMGGSLKTKIVLQGREDAEYYLEEVKKVAEIINKAETTPAIFTSAKAFSDVKLELFTSGISIQVRPDRVRAGIWVDSLGATKVWIETQDGDEMPFLVKGTPGYIRELLKAAGAAGYAAETEGHADESGLAPAT